MKSKLLLALSGLFVLFALHVNASGNTLEQNKAQYQTLVQGVVQGIVSGDTSPTNVKAWEAQLNQAANIGIEMSKQVMAQDPSGQALLGYLIKNVGQIKSSDLDTIEAQWHHGGAFPAEMKHDSFDHYGAVIGAKDAVVHPLTALVALQQFESTQNPEFLQTAQAELEEIIGQLQYIK